MRKQNTKKSNYKGKGRANTRSKVRSNDREFDEREATNNSTNDPAWYATSPELLRDSASIPFSWPSGTPLRCAGYVKDDIIPGVMALELKQVIGSSVNRNSAVNVASDAIYSFVRHANSGHSNYDAPDLMMYLVGMSSVYSFITWCQRLLGLVMTYDQRNRYIPDVLIRANYVDPASLRNNIANFRLWLNTLITKVGSFAIPNVMPYFNRMSFLYSNYYVEGPSVKDQFYMYIPSECSFLEYSLDSSSLGQLTYTSPTGTVPYSVDNIMTYGNTLFNSIWQQEDFGIMSGDIMKAYGDNIIKLASVPEMFVLQPVYDAMFLHQFKNAKCLHKSAVDIGRIFQDPAAGSINQAILPSSQGGALLEEINKQCFESNFILSSDFDNPTPEVVIESTRLMPTFIRDSIRYACGSEIPLHNHMWSIGGDGFTLKDQEYALAAPYDFAYSDSVRDNITFQRYFRYAPEFQIGTPGTTGWNFTSPTVRRMWEVDNYAVLDSSDLEKMHTAALMSLLAVPSIAKI